MPTPLVEIVATLVSPLTEKNPVKVMSSITPVVFSMSRIIVAVFAMVDAYRLAHAVTIGWPEAAITIAVIFALPVLAALSKVSAAEVVGFGKQILERFGVGSGSGGVEHKGE